MNQHAPAAGPLGHAAAARTAPGTALAQDAQRITAAARDLAARFRRGGRLLTFGDGPAAADAGHVAVEFTHPVIVGKRALPALSLSTDTPSTGASPTLFAARLRLLGRPGDIAMGILTDARRGGEVLDALAAARALGMLTIALTSGEPPEGDSGSGGPDALVAGGGASPAADHVLVARSDDPLIAREIHVTTYHLLWELAHVFLESPDSLASNPPGCRDDVCLTCADAATPVHITELRPGGLALAATDAGTEEISVALVQAQVGDVVLVHAKEAIAVLGGESR
ncbi:SIS domain-containing protein [Nonomuraea glycinis]|uniref:SIS domain-containing protein n=1 Tax=Nonomuraea glycinis TaxID=2047744 RepID=UPI002E11580A|nr:SIS domain-containing protein [Nonomuraea glycinis]